MKFTKNLTPVVAASIMSVSLTMFSAGMAAANPVVLISHDLHSRVSGELLEYKDGVYHIRTALCDLDVKASTVSCEGSGCPKDEIASQK